jgi:hypothetical protein
VSSASWETFTVGSPTVSSTLYGQGRAQARFSTERRLVDSESRLGCPPAAGEFDFTLRQPGGRDK